MTETASHVNATGENIATFDPLLTRPKKKLREILKSKSTKDKGHGV